MFVKNFTYKFIDREALIADNRMYESIGRISGRKRNNHPAKRKECGTIMKEIYLAGCCFWGMQKFIDQFDGVLATEVGYANGPDRAPSYKEVCQNSGHAETVRIVYDEEKLPLIELLRYYFMVIDPFSVNRQGEDAGIQYRTCIFYTEEYIRNQEREDMIADQISFKEYNDPFKGSK